MITYVQLSVVLFTSYIVTKIWAFTLDEWGGNNGAIIAAKLLARIQLSGASFCAGVAVAKWVGTLQ